MFEKVYPTEGRCPAEELQALLRDTRASNARFDVTLGSPPFERDRGHHITGIRLRFMLVKGAPSPDTREASARASREA